MLTEAQLNELLAIFLERSQSVVEEYLIRMGEQIQEIGELIPSSINRLVQLKKMNANLDAVKREIAQLAEISAEDLQRIFEAAQKTDARFVAASFGNEFRPSILENTTLKQLIEAQMEVTFGQMRNLSQTTIKSDAYRNVVDKAIQAAQMGVEDYNKSIRRALEEAADEGLKVEIGEAGAYETRIGYGGKYTRRLDSAIRQNVLDGLRSLSNATLMQLGEEFGADGIEISAHMLCAEDHLPYQGKQYSMQAFDALQEKLPRPFGMWNCKHSMHPILLGISEPAYSDEELAEYREFSNEQIEIDGVTKSRYQWTQEQRRIETAVRRQKDVSVCARASGDGKLRRDAQRTINALMDRYDKISKAAGLNREYDRMRVAGFKAMTAKQLQTAEKTDIIKTSKNIGRNMSSGLRTSRLHILTNEEIQSVIHDAESLSIPISILRFNEGDQTGFSDRYGVIYVRGDVLPDTTSRYLRDNLTQKAVLAHEYYGHYMMSPSPFRVGEWRDEFKASYMAALNAPNLTDEERRDLMLDAYDRAKEAGITVKYNKKARKLIYGHD